MNHLNQLKNIWNKLYDPKTNPNTIIEEYFHPDYEQCVNGVMMNRSEYLEHVIQQKKDMTLHQIEYKNHLENTEELFALYNVKGQSSAGSDIEAEVISYFVFQDEQLLRLHAQVRMIKGDYADVDMSIQAKLT